MYTLKFIRNVCVFQRTFITYVYILIILKLMTLVSAGSLAVCRVDGALKRNYTSMMPSL